MHRAKQINRALAGSNAPDCGTRMNLAQFRRRCKARQGYRRRSQYCRGNQPGSRVAGPHIRNLQHHRHPGQAAKLREPGPTATPDPERGFGATGAKEQAPKAIAARGDAANEFASPWVPDRPRFARAVRDDGRIRLSPEVRKAVPAISASLPASTDCRRYSVRAPNRAASPTGAATRHGR